MTASKSNRARNARNGAQASAGRNASAARPGGTARSGNAAARPGGTARNGNAGRNGGATGAGTAVKDGNAARGAAARGGSGGRRFQDDLAAASVATGPGPALWLQLSTFALALMGLGVSIYLTIAHFTNTSLAGCAGETSHSLVNCTKVTTSAQSYVFGIPVAVLGLAFYVFAVAIMSPWAWRASRREIHLVRLASVVVGIGFVLYLIYAELIIIGNICLYCTSVHAITFVMFVLTMAAVAVWGLRPGAPWPLRLGRRGARDTEAPAAA